MEKANILYVDDEQNNLVSFAATFRRYYNIFTAASAREGMEILKKTPIQVIITDQRMPEMTGVQFLESVIPDYPETIRLLLTGYSDIDAVIKAINNGRIYRYVTKPWNENELKITIDLALRTYYTEQENKILLSKLHQEVTNQKKIITLFSKYVPELILNDIFSDFKESTIISGEYRIVSILSSDIQNFAKISSQLDPRQTVTFLNDYFTMMSDCISRHKGNFNKLLGDRLLAIFGAPISSIDNPNNAVLCALDMIQILDKFNKKWEKIIGLKLEIGIGINTGEVIAGNIGSTDHIEYTVVGDTVNMTFQIEHYSRVKPNTILISESTYSAVKNIVQVEALSPADLEGKNEKIQLYRVEKRIPLEKQQDMYTSTL